MKDVKKKLSGGGRHESEREGKDMCEEPYAPVSNDDDDESWMIGGVFWSALRWL